MKTKKNFLKKLTAGLLGFVMTLGVGAAGFASSAGETKAADATVTFTMKGFNANSTSVSAATDYAGTGVDSASTSTIAATARNFSTTTGQVRGNQTKADSNFSIWNTAAIPGSIKSITLKTTSGSGTFNGNPNLVVGTSSQAGSTTSPTAATRSSDNKTLSWSVSGSNTYFRIYSAAKFTSGTVEGGVVTVTYEKAVTKYNVSFNMQGHGTAPSTQSIEAGGKVSEPTAPSVSGYIFGGWYEEAACTNKWNFSTGTISGTKVLYAKWTQKTALTLAADDVNMKLGDSNKSVAVTAGGSAVSGYTLTSGNTNVISIVNNQLHVVGRGDATITITKAEDANNTYTSGTFNVHVDYADITSFELDYTEGTLGKGGEATLPGVTILPANANQGFSWGDPIVSATSGEISYTFENGTLSIGANNTGEGTITFVATADGDSSKSADVVYTIEAAQIAHINGVSASATGEIVAKQYVGNAFNPQGFSFAPSWSEGDHEDVEITADDISWNALVAGSNPTGTYSCADGDFTVTITEVTVVNDTLVSIAFAEGCDMTNKSYYVGDSWDFSGLSIVGTMDSGKTAPAIASSNVTFSSNDAVATTTTQITVTASYQGLTTQTAKTITGIEVKEVTMDSLTINYTGGQPVLGTDFVFAGTIKGNMSNGTQQNVSVSDVDFEVNEFIITQQTVTVTHKTTGATGTFNVTYKTKDITYTTSWTRCTSTTDIVSGQTYILGYEATANSGTIIPMKNTNDSNYMNSGTSSGNNGTITMSSVTATSDYEVQLISSTEVSGAYYIKCGDKYISNKNVKNSCTLETETAKTTSFGITVGSNDVFTFKIAENASYHTLSYNTSSPRFACYGGTMKNLVVYKKVQTASGTADIIKLNAALKSGKTFNEGATISASDFDCSTLDNLNQTKTVTATSVSPATLVAGENTITVSYQESATKTWTTTVKVNATELAHLDHIAVVDGTGPRSFTRGGTFSSTGLKIMAYYSNTDKTQFPDRELSSGFSVDGTEVNMNVAGNYTVTVSYTENKITKSDTYTVTVNPKVSSYLRINDIQYDETEGAYVLESGVSNTVTLSFAKDGDEEVTASNIASFLSYNKDTKVLTVGSHTETTETGTITFNAGSQSTTLKVKVSAVQLTGFTASGTPEVANQYRNNSFVLNLNNITINGLYSDGSSPEFTADQFDWNTSGTHPVGTYKNNSDLTVTVDSITLADDSIKSISFASGCDMSKKEYWVGDEWNFGGLSLTGEMMSGLAASLDPSKISYSTTTTTGNPITNGTISVAAQYDGFTGTITPKEVSGINVKEVTMDSLTINYTGGQPVLGTDFVFNGTITANMSNGAHPTVNLSDVTFSEINKYITDPQTITVTHKTTGATGTFVVQYKVAQYWGPEPVAANTVLFNEPFSGFSKDAKPGSSNSSTTVYGGGSITYTCAESGTKIYNEELAGGTSPELLVAKSGGSFKMVGLPTGSAKVLSFTYACNNTNNEATCSSSAYTMTGSSGSYTLTLKDNTTAPATIDITISNSKSSNTRIDNLELKVLTPADRKTTDEQHPIRIVDATCIADSLLIGNTLTKNDFNISVQYDTSVTPVQNLTPTSIQRKTGENTYSDNCTLSAGDNIFKLTYGETYDGETYTVEKEITVPAAPKTLEGISLSYGDSFKNQFGINDTFTHEGVIVTANYANGYESEDITNSANLSFSSPDMTSAGEKTVTITYTEDGVQKQTSYKITVTAEKDANLIAFATEDTGATATLVDDKSASFVGYVGNTVSLEIKLVNFGNDVNVYEKLAVQGLSLTGSKSNGVYSGTITVSKEMIDQSYTITVSDGDKSFDIVLSFTAIEDYIESIEASNYQEEYTVGDDFNYEMTVTATYASGNTRVLEDSEYDVAVLELTRGNHNVTVTLKDSEINDTFMITVNKPDDLNIVTYYEIPGKGSYQLVTDVSQITVNGQYALGTSGAFINSSSVSSNAYQISSTETEFKLSATTDGYLIYCPDRTSTKYLANSDSTKAAWNSSGSTFHFTKDSESGYFYIQNASNGNRFLGFTNGDHTGVKYYATSNIGDYDFVYLYMYVPGEPTIGYKDNTDDISDALFDFVYAWGGDNLDITNWKDIFESTEYAALNKDDKELLQYAVVSSKDGTMVTTEMFADFITTYDEIVSKNGPAYNELSRSVEYEKYTVQINEQTPTTYQAGDEYTLPTATVAEGNKMVYATESGQVYDAGEKIVIHENLVLSAVEIQDVEKISVSTEANYKYNTDDNGNFSGVTQTTLRMYISMDADTYNFYVNHGYDFSIVIVNSKNGKSSIINSSSMSIKYDAEKDVYVFNVAFNIPASQYYSTDLQISLIASSQFASDETLKVTVNYMSAAESLYQAYLNGSVTLNSKQVAALKAILNIVD